jgi:hypothetical protein
MMAVSGITWHDFEIEERHHEDAKASLRQIRLERRVFGISGVAVSEPRLAQVRDGDEPSTWICKRDGVMEEQPDFRATFDLPARSYHASDEDAFSTPSRKVLDRMQTTNLLRGII